MSDGVNMAAVVMAANLVRNIPESVVERAEAAAERAEEAADTVTSATVEETTTYLGLA
jgi:hypothetical protein